MAFTTDATPPSGDPQGAAAPVGNEPQGTPGQGSEPQGQQQPPEPDYSLAQDFLQRVPEADRPVVERYVKQWDAGVTRRFQDLHRQYEPYQQLGNVEELQQAIAVMRLLDEQPDVIYNILMEDIQKGAEWAQGIAPPQQQAQMPPGAPPSEAPQFQGLPPEIQAKIDQQQTILEQLATIVLTNQQQAQAAAEDAALDEYLTNLRTEFGPFDEEYVLARMERGDDGETAVKAFHAMIQAQVNGAFQQQQDLPPVLSGGGAPPQQQQTVQSLGKKDVRSLVAQLVAESSAQGQ